MQHSKYTHSSVIIPAVSSLFLYCFLLLSGLNTLWEGRLPVSPIFAFIAWTNCSCMFANNSTIISFIQIN